MSSLPTSVTGVAGTRGSRVARCVSSLTHLSLSLSLSCPWLGLAESPATAPRRRSGAPRTRGWVTHARVAAALCAAAATFACACAGAQAADKHDYISQFDEVPAVGPHGETVALPGPVINPNAMTVNSGELYLSDDIYHEAGRPISRLDRFNAANGAFTGQFAWPAGPATYSSEGIAVGHAGGETQIYVTAIESNAGESAGVLGVFDRAGALQRVWRGSETAGKDFSCCGQSGVAVDDSSGLLGDWAAGDVYVTDSQNNVVNVFEPEAGAGEKKPVAELKGVSPSEPFSGPYRVTVSPVSGDVVVADSDGVHVFRPSAIPGQYEFVATLLHPSETPFQSRVSISADDGEGDVYVIDTIEQKIYEFNSAYEYQGQLTPETAPDGFWGGEAAQPAVVGSDPETHRVYIGTYDSNQPAPVFVFGPNVVLPDVETVAASNARPTSATLNGTVKLDKGGPATCQFEWGTSSALGEVAPCPAKVEAEGKVPVSVSLGGLESGTTYYYRLQATNANGTNDESQLRQFTTLGPQLVEASASDVASTSATLNATIDPDGNFTTYYFQYGKSAAYEEEVPLAPGAPLGAGTSEVAISHHIQNLAPGTTYHYRTVMVSEIEVEPKVMERFEFPGRDATFTTQIAGGTGLALPDNRRWEMVSPTDKHGATIKGIIKAGAIGEAAATGEALTYIATIPTESEAAGSSNGVLVQVLSTRGASGWSSHDIMLPHAAPTGPSFDNGGEYRMFSEDLSLGLIEPFGEYTPLADEATPPDSERTLYLRHDFTCTTTPGSCYEPLVTGSPGYADVPPGTVFGGESNQPSPLHFLGGTPDLAHVVLGSSVPLTPTGGDLYEWSAASAPGERLQSVAVLPADEGGGAVTGASLGISQAGSANRATAISADGTRVVWRAAQALYLRDLPLGETVRLDAVQGGSGHGYPEPIFQFASDDGARVFFTDSLRLTADSNAAVGKPDLYECEIARAPGGLECRLSDLTSGSGGRSANVQGGLLGADRDGHTLYFVATGALSSAGNARNERATAGADNLYMLRYDARAGKWETPRLIGVLSREDAPDWTNTLAYKPARTSPDGRYLAFMSERPLTGYDNHDAASRSADEEVYLYDSASNRLACASCNPTGALPHGVEDDPTGLGRLVNGSIWPASRWLAANVPGWTPYAQSEALYQSRFLSNEGRLFFNSSDALVPQDINGTEDVYEYEPAGVGDCTAASPTFGEASGGCVSLISSGASAEESAFLDASENGGDVFFLTAESLLAQDVDTAYDVYDAHVCTSRAPCVEASVPAPACATADACRAASTPQPAAFGAPASATFAGAGNVTPVAPLASVKPKALTNAQRLARALSACHRRYRSHKGRRAACERQARRRFGGVGRPRKVKATKRGGR